MMRITEKKIKIKDLFEGYVDNGEGGVVAYDGKLDVRPPFQREFIYEDKERNAVIDSVLNEYPLNLMYWAVKDDGNYEIIDGQQRTISICEYKAGNFSFDFLTYDNLPSDKKEIFDNYELSVYLCEGTESEKLAWFKVINIAGKILNEQELRNAVYAGPWLSDAKKKFSKTNCVAYNLARNYVTGSPIRQDFLETALDWISKGNIQIYMGNHQHCSDASDLWIFFQNVINWVQAKFPTYRSVMKGVPWGDLYNRYKDTPLDPVALEADIKRLMLDDDVSNKKGIYEYLLDHSEKHLNIRAFTESQRLKQYEAQAGICPICGRHFEYAQMEADHITPWCEGGRTEQANCQMLCRTCNREKSSN